MNRGIKEFLRLLPRILAVSLSIAIYGHFFSKGFIFKLILWVFIWLSIDWYAKGKYGIKPTEVSG